MGQYNKPFQSTFPQGERRREIGYHAQPLYVSIHVPARGTTDERLKVYDAIMVSIHVPARGTTPSAFYDIIDIKVSIHVPARGTTFFIWRTDSDNGVSIHVPARGTTNVYRFHIFLLIVSIHVPARGTTNTEVSDKDQINVSIHVPTRGTTAIIYKFSLYFLLLSMQLYQYNPSNASPADHTHLILSQYYGANLPDTLCSLLFRTDPILHCCFIKYH